jgi:hypothetical protein
MAAGSDAASQSIMAPPAGSPITRSKLTSPSLLLNFRIKSIEAVQRLQITLQ